MESEFMWIENVAPSRHGCNGKTAQTMATHLSCAVSYLRSALINNSYQYLMGLVAFFCSACNNTHPSCKVYASIFRMMCPVGFCSARMGGDMIASFSKFMDFHSLLLRGSNVFAWSLCSFAFKGAVMQAKFKANRQKAIQSSRKEQSFVRLVKGCNPKMAFVV